MPATPTQSPPPTLAAALLGDPAGRAELARALAALVREEVARRRGLSGATLRSALATLERLKAGFVERAVAAMLADWIEALEPHYQRHLTWCLLATETTFGAHVTAHRDAIAAELVAIAGRKVERSGSRTVRVFFRHLSETASANVAAVVPRLGQLVDAYLYPA
jgi:hypothetical protein